MDPKDAEKTYQSPQSSLCSEIATGWRHRTGSEGPICALLLGPLVEPIAHRLDEGLPQVCILFPALMNWETLEKDSNLLIHQMETIKDGDSLSLLRAAYPSFLPPTFILRNMVRQRPCPQRYRPGGLADNKQEHRHYTWRNTLHVSDSYKAL